MLRAVLHRLSVKFAALEDRVSVRQQIGIAAAALSIALVAALTTGAALVSRQQAAKSISGHMSQLARSMANQLDLGMLSHYREVRNLATLEPLVAVWSGSPDKMRALLNKMQASQPGYTWIGFASVNGKVIAATQGLLEGVSVAERPWFRNGRVGSAVEDVHEAKLLAKLLGETPNGEPFRFVDVAFPVFGPDGKLIGVLGAHLSWQWANDLRKTLLQSTAAPADTDLWILARDGTVLLGPALGTQPFTPSEFALMQRTPHGAFVDHDEPHKFLTGYATTRGAGDYTGLGWIVIARQPESAAFAGARALTWIIAILGAVVGLFGVLLSLGIAGRIARPIHALTIEADRIGRDPTATMLPRQRGSGDVVGLSGALRSLLRRVGLAEQRSQASELREASNAAQFADDLRALRKLADTDPLTNLMNRRAFLAAGNDAIAYFKRYDRPMGTLIIDIDHFKKVNDTYGHAAGDAAIRRVGELVEAAIRTTDKAARFGGEEFVVLLREVDEVAARAFAERVRAAVEAEPVKYGEQTIPITVSVGTAVADANDRDIEDTIDRADQALYMAKNTGRNCTFYMPANRNPDGRRAA